MTSSPSEGRREAEAFEEFCAGALTTNEGGALVIEGFQRQMLADYFDGVRSSLIIIPKKNGKTTLLGALALFHLLTVPDAECVIAAASREQAGLMLRQIRGFIRRSLELTKRLHVTKRVIEYERLGGQIRILASDVDTVDGAIPTLALIDELHRHKHPDVYGVLRDGLGPRGGQLITISTAGDDENSPLGQLRASAYTKPGMVRDGCYRYVRTPEFALHEWALDPEQDRDDLKLVKQANPASWQTTKELKKRKDDPSMTPWQWARFACGVWMVGEEAAVSDREWRACAKRGLRIPAGVQGVHIGVDLAWKWDCTAIVPIWLPGDSGPAQVHPPRILTPPRDGTSIAQEEIFAPIEDFCERWPKPTIVIDPAADGEQLAQRIEAELDAVVVEHTQKPSTMALAAQRLAVAISSRAIQHPDDAALNAHVLAAAAKQVGESWRFVKRSRKQLPIDGVIALAMAHSVLVASDTTNESVYNHKDLLVLD